MAQDERSAESKNQQNTGPGPAHDLEHVSGLGVHPLTAAALVGGALAAGAGAFLGTRAIARRNKEADGRKLNAVMANAITACDLNRGAPELREPGVPHEPEVVHEPKVPVA